MINFKKQIVVNRIGFRKIEGELDQLEDIKFLTTVYSSDSKSLLAIVSALNAPMIKSQLQLNSDGEVNQVHSNLLTTNVYVDDIRNIVINLVLNKKKWTEIETNTDGSCFMFEWT